MIFSRNRLDIGRGFRMLMKLSLCLIGLVVAPSQSVANLFEEQKSIEQLYPQVEHIGAAQLQVVLDSDEHEVALFDVRESHEFDVSHILGAIHVKPGITAEQFLALHGDRIQGKRVVFYCSVGYRSSHLANLVQSQLPVRSPIAVFNLRHGLFGWHNEENELVRGDMSTELIHPYDFWWSRHIKRRHLISRSPELEDECSPISHDMASLAAKSSC